MKLENKFGPGDCVIIPFTTGSVLVTRIECIWFHETMGVRYGVKGYNRIIPEKHLCAGIDELKNVDPYDPPVPTGC